MKDNSVGWGILLWVAAMIVAGAAVILPATGNQLDSKLGCTVGKGDDEKRNRIALPTETDLNQEVTLAVMLGMTPGKQDDLKKMFEGKPQAATLLGTVLDVVLGGEEASNCNMPQVDRQTVYLYLVPKGKVGATKQDAMRIAITPRMRLIKAKSKLDWSFAELAKLKGKDILTTGWLYFDATQWPYALDNGEVKGTRNIWIKTCWSLHPVTDLKEFAP